MCVRRDEHELRGVSGVRTVPGQRHVREQRVHGAGGVFGRRDELRGSGHVQGMCDEECVCRDEVCMCKHSSELREQCKCVRGMRDGPVL